MPTVRSADSSPVAKKPKRMGSATGKKKIVTKKDDPSPKIKKKTSKITVVAKKNKIVEKEKPVKKKTVAKKKVVEASKTAKKTVAKKPRKQTLNSKSSASPDRKSEKVPECPTSPKPKKVKKLDEIKESAFKKKDTKENISSKKTEEDKNTPAKPSKKRDGSLKSTKNVETPKAQKKSSDLKEVPNKIAKKLDESTEVIKKAAKKSTTKGNKKQTDLPDIKSPQLPKSATVKNEAVKSEIKKCSFVENVKSENIKKCANTESVKRSANTGLSKIESVKKGTEINKAEAVKKGVNTDSVKTETVKKGANAEAVKKTTNAKKKNVKPNDAKKEKIKLSPKKVNKPNVDKSKRVGKSVNIKAVKSLSKEEPEIKDETLIKSIILEVKDNCEKVKNMKKDNIIRDEDIDSKETIAQLLEQANKTLLLKNPSKKKRNALKLNKTNAVQMKSKANKQKPKKVEIKQEYEEDVDLFDLKQVAKIIKATKTLVKDNKKDDKTEIKREPEPQKPEESEKIKHLTLNKSKDDNDQTVNTDDSSTSDELTLDVLRQNHIIETKSEQANLRRANESSAKSGKKLKAEASSDSERKPDKKNKPLKKLKQKPVRKVPQKKKMVIIKKRVLKQGKNTSTDTEQKGRKLKLYGFWNGPKRHRVASLNALAKVHCLYENESRGALLDVIKRTPSQKSASKSDSEPIIDTVEPTTRTLRSVPGLRGVGKHWEMHDDTSSFSSDNESSVDGPKRVFTLPPSYKQKQQQKEQKKQEALEKKEEKVEKKEEKEDIKEEKNEDSEVEVKPKKKVVRKKRSRTELIMDLKDMVVRKRMASLNASAILAASYSVEKKPLRSPKTDDSTSDSSDTSVESVCSDKKRKCYDPDVKKEEDRKVIEVHASPNKKVAVILNQDTDVTITGVYVNSTTRSAHHEGYCSIAGMQYRISATSHTQTNATAVATETLLHTGPEHVSDIIKHTSYFILSLRKIYF